MNPLFDTQAGAVSSVPFPTATSLAARPRVDSHFNLPATGASVEADGQRCGLLTAHQPERLGLAGSGACREEGFRKVCMDCGAELPGSNSQGSRTSHGLCRADFDRRMAELGREAA
jgi:hypothetical protein